MTTDEPSDWAEALGDLGRRREASRAMGGAERLRRHHEAGKLDARARVARLLDPGSFTEIGALVGGSEAPADAVVTGAGRVRSETTPGRLSRCVRALVCSYCCCSSLA